MNLGPSALIAFFKIAKEPPGGFSFAFIILVLHTSIGEHLPISEINHGRRHCGGNKASHKACSEMRSKVIPKDSCIQQ